MIKLINILFESTQDSFNKIDQEVSKLFRENPPQSFREMAHIVSLICLKNNIDYKDYLRWLNKHKKGLNEIQIRSSPIFPEKYVKEFSRLWDDYGHAQDAEQHNYTIYHPFSEKRNIHDYYNYDEDKESPESIFIKKLFEELGTKEGRIYLHKDLFGFDPPKNNLEYRTLIKVGLDFIELITPNVSKDGLHYVGFFDSKGKYIPDVENFDDEGNKIL